MAVGGGSLAEHIRRTELASASLCLLSKAIITKTSNYVSTHVEHSQWNCAALVNQKSSRNYG